MLDILFRGKGTSGYCAGEWVYGYYCYDFRGKKDHGILPVDKNCGGYCEVTPETVGQYTGLTDKNGKKIFEGDIVQAYFRSNHRKQTFCVCFDDGMVLFDDDYVKVPKYGIYAMAVIGNIHDNTELLGGADNG